MWGNIVLSGVAECGPVGYPGYNFRARSTFYRVYKAGVSRTLRAPGGRAARARCASPLPRANFRRTRNFTPRVRGRVPRLRVGRPPVPCVPATRRSVSGGGTFGVIGVITTYIVNTIVVTNVTVGMATTMSNGDGSVFNGGSVDS